jgi:small-conductance mechanosensitive channel/CRP-like cAMP-binding protein
MESFIFSILSNPLFAGALLFIIVIYSRLAVRSAKLPRIPLGLFILYLFAVLFHMALVSQGITEWDSKINLAKSIIFYCAAARIIFYFFIDLWLAKARKALIPKIIRDLSLAAIFSVIALVLLYTRGGFNLASLLTTSAVLTMVIGLAAQETLGNLFAGLALQTEKFFQIGEWISFREHVGQVVGMTWKSTLIKTLENEIIYIPNSVVSKEVIKNYSRPDPQHIVAFEIGVEYGAPPNKVREVILQTLDRHPKIVKDPPPQVRLVNFGDFAITYQIRFWNNDFEKEKMITAELMNDLWYALRRNEITIPFPIRDVRMHHIEMEQDAKLRECMMNEMKNELGKIPVLKPLSQDDINLLASRMKTEEYGSGEVIVREGEAGDSMYIIKEGRCDVLVSKGGAKPVAVLGADDFFGEMSLLTGAARSATVVARSDAKLFMINKCAFEEVMKKHPAVAEALAEALNRRQAALAELMGKKQEAAPSAAAQILSKIRSFFGIS